MLGYTVISSLLGSLFSAILPLTLVFPLRLFFPHLPWLLDTVDAIAVALSLILVTPFTTIALTTLYYDLRLRGTREQQAGNSLSSAAAVS